MQKRPPGYADVTNFWSFNTSKVSKATKYVFLVACNEDKTRVEALFIISKQDLQGRHTVHIPADPIRGYFQKFLFKVLDANDRYAVFEPPNTRA